MSKNKNSDPLNLCVRYDGARNNRDSLCKLVIIVLSDSWHNNLLEIECLSRNFNNCIVLYVQGCIKLFLNPSPKITDLLIDTIEKSHKKLKLENIGSWSSYYDTFLILSTSDREQLVLIKDQNTDPLFDLLKEEFSSNIVSAKLVDLAKNNSNNRMTIDEVKNQQNVREGDNIFDQDKSTSTVSLKPFKKIVPPSYDSVPMCVILPLSREIPMNENYPQQVSEEQNIDERSLLYFSNGISLPVTTDNTSSFANGDRNLFSQVGQNTISGEARSLAHNSASSRPRARYPTYIDFHKRLASYARWIHSSPDPNTLSKAGFFYTDDADLVRCFQCGIGLKDFCQEDDPLKEHVKHSGDCPYLVEVIGEDRLIEWKRLLQAQDPEYNRRMQWNNRNNVTLSAHSYRHPEYQTREKRVETFVNWPAQMHQRPEQLADAGLFYTGFEDLVRCFACDGGLRRWDPVDDPWTEHCRWFPACPFARETKGDDYIALIQASINLENEGEASEPRGEDLSEAMEQMTLRDPGFKAALDEHKDACLAMGYQLTEFNEAVQEIRNRGTIKPSIEEIVDVIEVIQTRKQQDKSRDTRQNETPIEQNQRLKSYVICMKCERNEVNALFIPCTHHRLCMTCAEHESNCPVCGKQIRQKIRTYMV